MKSATTGRRSRRSRSRSRPRKAARCRPAGSPMTRSTTAVRQRPRLRARRWQSCATLSMRPSSFGIARSSRRRPWSSITRYICGTRARCPKELAEQIGTDWLVFDVAESGGAFSATNKRDRSRRDRGVARCVAASGPGRHRDALALARARCARNADVATNPDRRRVRALSLAQRSSPPPCEPPGIRTRNQGIKSPARIVRAGPHDPAASRSHWSLFRATPRRHAPRRALGYKMAIRGEEE